MYSDALERKLQPIYDAIDSRSYKVKFKSSTLFAALKKLNAVISYLTNIMQCRMLSNIPMLL